MQGRINGGKGRSLQETHSHYKRPLRSTYLVIPMFILSTFPSHLLSYHNPLRPSPWIFQVDYWSQVGVRGQASVREERRERRESTAAAPLSSSSPPLLSPATLLPPSLGPTFLTACFLSLSSLSFILPSLLFHRYQTIPSDSLPILQWIVWW